MEHEKEGRHIPNLLRKHRRINGYSQKEVAQILGLKSTNRISRWEQGISMPSYENLLQLAILYGTLSDELYFSLREKHRARILKSKAAFKEQQNNPVQKPVD